MNKTRKSLWNIAQSWWILLTFTFILNWVAFLYIGKKVKNKRWSIYGAIYSIPFIFSFFVTLYDIQSPSIVYTVWSASLFIGWLISIIHAFKVRKAFLIRLEARQLAKQRLLETLTNQIEAEYRLDPDLSRDVPFNSPVPTTVFTKGSLTRQS